MSQEELQAEERLKKAENKISGLLHELDELRFFQELEQESSSKTLETPQTPSRNTGVPTNIRALSPARGGRLPPPPSSRASKSKGGGLETYQPLSPRKIAKLDRNSLELECQTLVRKLQIIDKEKQSQAAMIEMYEISMQEHDFDKGKIKKLEEKLKNVSVELKRQLQNIQRGKESLVKEYEERIQNNVRQLERIQEKADSFKVDLGVAKADAEKWKNDSEKREMELKDRNDKFNDLKAKHMAQEEQLNSLREVNSGVVHKVEKKSSEIAALKEDLCIARKVIEESKEARDETYEEKILELEGLLSFTKEDNANLETQCLQIKATVTKRDKALDAASKLESENVALISKLRSRLSDLERANETRFEEGKRAAKVVENKRMQELVGARAKEAKDYECRLTAMQEQLRHQSDRHNAEIEETRKRNDENLCLMRDEVKDEIRRIEGDQVAQLDLELKTQKRNYAQMKADFVARIREHQQKAREVAADFQQKTEVCQSELERVHGLVAELGRSNAQKDDDINHLKETLIAGKEKLDNDVRAMEAKANTEIHKCKQMLDQERKSFASTEASLQADIVAQKSEKAAIERKSREQAQGLSQHINVLQRQLAEAQSIATGDEENKLRLQELEKALQATQNEQLSERAHNKEVAEAFVLERDRKEIQIEDLRHEVDFLQTERGRKERELSSLRQDYQDMSDLLEENLHSNSNDGARNTELKRRERELKETVNICNSRYSDLETKMQADINRLKTKLQRCEAERDSLVSQLAHTKGKNCSAIEELGETSENFNGSTIDAGRKDSHIRDVVQRYTRVIAGLETKLEEESLFRGELEDKLASAKEELKEKQQYTQEVVQRHTNNAMQLESNLRRVSKERDDLEMRLDQMTNDLVQRRKELEDQKATTTDECATPNSVKKLEEDYHEMSEVTRNHLDRKEKQLKEMKQKIPELLAELDARTRERDQCKAATIKIESELAKRKIQFDITIDQYIKQVSELEVRLEEKSENMSLTRDDYEVLRLESSCKDRKILEMKQAIKELESLLENASNNKDKSRQKVETIARELDEKRVRSTALEMEKFELESKLLTLSRAKDDLRSKVTELTSRVERKEREVREVTDRYKMHVMELELKLDQDSDARHTMKKDIDKLKGDLSSAASVSAEALELRGRVYSLQREVDESRALARDADVRAKEMTRRIESRLESAVRDRDEIENTLQKLAHEKSEVINALEGVINEVQNREDEIESLTEILQRRDEELQHAKVIATKALQSAKDIQKRYKVKEKDRHSDMMNKMDELHDNIDMLSSKNDSLQRKISMLERDLRDRNLECKQLKVQLRQVDGRPLRCLDQRHMDEAASISKAREDGSTYSQASFRSFASRNAPLSTSSSFHRANAEEIGGVFLEDDDYEMSVESFSPSNSTEGFHDDTKGFPIYQSRPSEDASEYETSSRGGYESVNDDTISKRKIEQNALRDYVRQRFAKR
ncbi:MAG: hypothetical protein SGBAC_007862 [Bacillariaceae sp.]